jgi:hypothetical protein
VTKEEFQALAEAFGGEIARWPAAQRDEAALLSASERTFAGAVLARESGLDAVLDELPRPTASAALFEQIVASAPPSRSKPHWRFWLAPAGLGAALAGVAAAGVLLGVQVSERSAVNADTAGPSVADLDVSAVQEEG